MNRGAKKCAKTHRDGIGFTYKFTESDQQIIDNHWKRIDEQSVREENARKKRRGNDGEVFANENVDGEEQKLDVETVCDPNKDDKPAPFRFNEKNRQIVFKQMIQGNYMILPVQFRAGFLKNALHKLVMANPHLAGMTIEKMKDCFIEIKRRVLKLYKDGEDLELQRLKESERMVLEYLKSSGIADSAVRMTGFAS